MTIKFIDLGFQVDEKIRYFSFWDFNTNDFIRVSHHEAWTNWGDFQEDVETEGGIPFLELEQIKMSCPLWVFQSHTPQMCPNPYAAGSMSEESKNLYEVLKMKNNPLKTSTTNNESQRDFIKNLKVI